MEDADMHYRGKQDAVEAEFNSLSKDATKAKASLAESNALMMQAVQEAKTNASAAARYPLLVLPLCVARRRGL